MKYLLRIRQVALAGFHFTYDTWDKLGEEEGREMRDSETRETENGIDAGKRRKQLTNGLVLWSRENVLLPEHLLV